MGVTSIATVPVLVIFVCFFIEYRIGHSQHPIDTMIISATQTFDQLLAQETKSCSDAVAAYQARRGRPPPPGFTQWFQLAQELNAIVVEQFWDPVYEDLDVFWGISPAQIQSQIESIINNAQSLDISIFQFGDGNVNNDCGSDQFCPEFNDMFRQVADLGVDILPAMTLPVNRLITPRIFMPYTSARQEPDIHSSESIQEVHSLRDSANLTSMVKGSCDPASPIHKSTDRNTVPRRQKQTMTTNVVEEFARMKSVCDHPKLLESHGSFVDPQYPELATTELALVFSVQKIRSVNQEIRIPSTLYWSEPASYFAEDFEPWDLKTNKVFWRGGNSGGRVDQFNWRHFHRHLLVAGLNSTLIEGAAVGRCPSWALSDEICQLPPQHRNRLADFARQNMDVGFYAFGCVDKNFTRSTESGCDYLDENFRPLPTASLQNVQGHKYLLDVDGNGYSARFRSFLFSNSVPIKATIYEEWHDSRLVPWKHFVPLDNSFASIWDISHYFLGECPGTSISGLPTYDSPCKDRDEKASSIAHAGSEWARKVLRKEDMVLYLLRLMMEYGRVIRADRDDCKEHESCLAPR